MESIFNACEQKLMQLMIRRRIAKNVTLEAKIVDLKEKMEPLKTNSEYMEKSKLLQKAPIQV